MTRRTERAARLSRELAMNSQEVWWPDELANQQLAGVEPSTLKQILDREAARPMRGGDAELGYDSLFGDSHKQPSLF